MRKLVLPIGSENLAEQVYVLVCPKQLAFRFRWSQKESIPLVWRITKIIESYDRIS